MDHTDHKEVDEVLHDAGFTTLEIARLHQLRRAYDENKSSHISPDQRRLEFVRWLVTTGRLSDQVA